MGLLYGRAGRLTAKNGGFRTGEIPNAPWRLHDSPRFAHRGLMVDLSRHFQPLASIRSIIDGLSYAKLNVLHMHMSDEQSFPMESTTYPKLWDAAFSDQERYTQADLASLVEYALGLRRPGGQGCF
jgi:hexosaminidase